jgi:hypothetical protein
VSSKRKRSTQSKAQPAKTSRAEIAENGREIVEYPQGSPFVRRSLVVVASLFLLAVFSEGVRPGKLTGLVYQPVLLFCQMAALFPKAATHSIEYRAQGYTCAGPVKEIDLRPYFPIHADDKENRFSRAMHFVRSEPTAMDALEAYVMREYNRDATDKIGGVSFVGLYVPIPAVGTPFSRNTRLPLSDFPKDVRHVIHVTPHETVLKRCREGGL